jgi:hypothetical protein
MTSRIATAAAVLAALAFAGCGGDAGERGSAQGALIWKGKALAIPAGKNLPDDRIVGGRVRNDSFKTVRIEARDIRLVTAGGRVVKVAALAFIDHYAHGIFPPTRREGLASKDEQEAEDRRLGRVVTLRPREDVPLTVAWRQPDGAPQPVSLRYPGGSLPLPR